MRKGSGHDPTTLIKMSNAKKGKTWEEIYGVEEANKKRERLKKRGKEHFNYGRKRPDIAERNKTKNSMWDKKNQEKSSISHTIHGRWAGRSKAKRYLGKMWYCWKCGSRENIDVHHKDKNRANNKLENLEILCRKCHVKLHKDERNGIFTRDND